MDNLAVQVEWERTFVWIGDTGASCHMLCIWSEFVDYKTTSTRACFVMRDDKVDANAVGTWKGRNHLTKKWIMHEKGSFCDLQQNIVHSRALKQSLLV